MEYQIEITPLAIELLSKLTSHTHKMACDSNPGSEYKICRTTRSQISCHWKTSAGSQKPARRSTLLCCAYI